MEEREKTGCLIHSEDCDAIREALKDHTLYPAELQAVLKLKYKSLLYVRLSYMNDIYESPCGRLGLVGHAYEHRIIDAENGCRAYIVTDGVKAYRMSSQQVVKFLGITKPMVSYYYRTGREISGYTIDAEIRYADE